MCIRDSATSVRDKNQIFDGVLESVKNGTVRGWAVEKLPSNPFVMFNWDVPVSIYLNDWYVGETTHTYARKDLAYERLKSDAKTNITCEERPGFGFDFPLPINFFSEKEIDDFTLEVRIARRNVLLARTPCQWSGREAYWDKDKQCWTNTDLESVTVDLLKEM